MGGSLIANNIAAVPYNLEQGISELFMILFVVQKTNPGWGSHVPIEDFLAGSSHVAIDNRIEMRNNNIQLGDIDIMVDRDFYDGVCASLEKQPEVLYFRKGKIRSTGLIKVAEHTRQFDIIPCEFENGAPKKFFVFSHSSSILDMRYGIKGFAHKLLCRAFTAGTNYHFSVDYGLREDGSSEYDTNFISVVNKVFGANAYRVWSFISMLRVLETKPAQQQALILDKFCQLVFGDSRQKSSRFPQKDLANMTAIYKTLHLKGFATPTVTKMYNQAKEKI